MQLISAIIVVIALAMPIFKENINIQRIGKLNSLNEMKQNKSSDLTVKEKLDKKISSEMGGGIDA